MRVCLGHVRKLIKENQLLMEKELDYGTDKYYARNNLATKNCLEIGKLRHQLFMMLLKKKIYHTCFVRWKRFKKVHVPKKAFLGRQGINAKLFGKWK